MSEMETLSLRIFGRDLTLACPPEEKDQLIRAAKLLNDELDEISKEERLFLGSSSKTFKVRKVILFGDDAPIVFAKSVIPTLTIDKGLSSLGKIGNAPLGDILFTPSVFIKLEMVCASFLSEERNVYWGRKIKYSVNSEPISVMEVFLI